MNKDDAVKVLHILKAAYPQSYKCMTRAEGNAVLDLWSAMFADDDTSHVLMAVKSYIASDTKGFPPAIGQIKQKIRLITQPFRMSAAEAWALVSKAAEDGYYNAEKEFVKLPPMVQRILGRAQTLREYSLMDTKTFETVTQSNFIKAYNALDEQEAEIETLPSEAKQYRLGWQEGTLMKPTENIAEIEAVMQQQYT